MYTKHATNTHDSQIVRNMWLLEKKAKEESGRPKESMSAEDQHTSWGSGHTISIASHRPED